MKLKYGLFLLVLCSSLLFNQDEIKFTFQNQSYDIKTELIHNNTTRLILKTPDSTKEITQGIQGINHHPVARFFKEYFVITFHSMYQELPYLYMYNSKTDNSELLFYSPDFKFISTPLFIPRGKDLIGIVFLGNNSNNDDLFYYSLESEVLINLTQTPESEKKFKILTSDPITIEIVTLYEKRIIEFDPILLKIRSSLAQPIDLITKVISGKEDDFRREDVDQGDEKFYRTFITFGDSITAGQIEGVLYPLLAYPYKTEQKLRGDYGDIYHIEIGVPGEDTYEATQRIHQALIENAGKYFFYLQGTNDVWTHRFSIDSSIENIEYTINTVLNDDREVVMSTIPPRKWPPVAMGNIRKLNTKIRQLARDKGLPFTEIFHTFMDYSEGWEVLMENTHKKNHPNALGHSIIADLLYTGILKVKPQTPKILSQESLLYYRYKVTWEQCPDFDFSHHHVEYGYSPNSYIHEVSVDDPEYIFNLIPFDNLVTDIYFRIKSVDVHGIESEPSEEFHLTL